MAAKKSSRFNQLSPRERITQVAETWFLTEPLLFAAWTMHDVVAQPAIETIRVARGRVEFNPTFIASLRRDQLRDVLSFEAMRILLGHPYDRRKPEAELSYMASNLTVQECLRTGLPVPRAREVFSDDAFDDQYFEFYYRELSERSQQDPPEDPGKSASDARDEPNANESQNDASNEEDGGADDESSAVDESLAESSDETDDAPDSSAPTPAPAPSSLDAYADPQAVGVENTLEWDSDELLQDEIHTAVREAAEHNGWGSIAGSAKEQLLATLNPKLNYRAVLRQFRQSVLAVQRRLTRMKPSRRYGFAQMGSRYDFTTKLLFAVDVSGSMNHSDLQAGFSVVSNFFRYGVESVDVIWFDVQIQSEVMTLKRAKRDFVVTGRGGTEFQPVIDFIDEHRQYDGLIIFTDGYAAVPRLPQNRRTRILWLFKDESTFNQMDPQLAKLGKAAFLRSNR
ncbi:DUF2201 family putative metallopeptidase [Rhodopirellula sp. MGV]|uniref:DUF2201 family putative metallopeptidase n=1 Tax=Rhodopirellula sp. MGV TaxID=2023130 RepID=UPI000B963011|nr:VWA-like domain-containing protein [Rhodopirellula sp. MGV]OYP36830.1 hypothetical protein CGZ80_07220 [Rhodopirellula sp. MGV]PNY36463.1 hypothetical protein C2E31_12760 [Rhodopirellula baltica]